MQHLKISKIFDCVVFYTEKTVNYYKSQRPIQQFLNYSMIAEAVGHF